MKNTITLSRNSVTSPRATRLAMNLATTSRVFRPQEPDVKPAFVMS
jgi:hypothetical protein